MAKDFLSGIEALRKKPVEVRNRYAFGIAFVCTFIILAMWGLSLPSRIASTAEPAQGETQERGALEEVASALAGYRDRFNGVVASFTEKYRNQDYQSATTTNEGPVFDLDLKALISSSTQPKATTSPSFATTTAAQETATTSTTTVETQTPQIP